MTHLEDETRDDDADPLIEALAWTPKVAPFTGTERYKVCSCLGEGGFGVVYEVEDRELGRRLALKTLKPNRSGFAGNIHRLKREFRSVADLVHPNLVGLHQLSSDGPRWFFTMDLVRGSTLLEHVRGEAAIVSTASTVPARSASPPACERGRDSSGVLSEPRLRACLRQLVAGVSALHDAGIIHRDLKPSNVLVEDDGRVVILDFGLADSEQPGDTELLMAGTPVYMAPEQAAGGQATAAADWYAIGVMLYEALTGRRPPPGGDRPSAHCPVPPDLERLCLALLRPDPQDRPDAAAIREMLGGQAPAARRAEAREVFVGRTGEQAALAAGFAAIRRGEPTVIRVHGQPGVGKSALLERFLDLQRKEGRAVILAGRCHERESVPFKAFDGVIDVLVKYLQSLPRNQASGLMPRDIHLAAQLFPVLEGVVAVRDVPRRQAPVQDPSVLRAKAFAAIKELIGRIADKQPLVIAIDDLQWGDVDSARLLAHLVVPPDRPAVLLLLAFRTDEAEHNPTLRETLHTLSMVGARGAELRLEPLPPRDAEDLVAALLGDRGRGAARAIAERGEGHPLFMAELARAHLLADPAAGDAPPTLLDILWERVLRLSASARALLETVAVAGQPLPSGLCFEAAGLGAGGVDAVRVLRAEQLVRAGDRDDINVFHDRIRDAVLLRSDACTRRLRHLALARSLERRPEPDLEALARHFDAADDRAQAARYAVRAADAAMAGLAFERAAALYKMAIDRGGEDSTALYEKLGYALLHAGRSVAAGEAFLAAAARVEGESARKTDLTRLAAEHLLVVGNVEAGNQALDQALAAVGEARPASFHRAWVMLAAHIVKLRVRRSRFRERDEDAIAREELLRLDVLDSACKGLAPTDPVGALGMSARFYRLAIKAGEPRRAARALIGSVPSSVGYAAAVPALANELLDSAEAIGQRLSDPDLVSRVLAMRGMLYFIFNDWARGAELSERAAANISEQCRGMASEYHDALLIAAGCHAKAGRFAAAGRLGEALLLGAVERGDTVYQKQVCAGVLAPLRLAADQPDEAHLLVEQVGTEPRCATIVLRAEAAAAIAMYRGRPREAIEVWRAWWPKLEEMSVRALTGFRTRIVNSLATALIAGAESRREVREAARLMRSVRRLRFPHARAVHAILRSQLAMFGDRRGEAAKRLAEAADHLDQAGMPHEAAACRYRHGRMIGGEDGTAETAAAGAALRAIGIASPERWTAMILPEVGPARRLLVE
jgi:serine/threonine protein kinase